MNLTLRVITNGTSDGVAREGPATALPAECRAPAHEVGSPKMLGENKSSVPNCGCSSW